MVSMKFSTFIKKNKNQKSDKICTIHVFKILLHTVNLIQLNVKLRVRLFSFVLTLRLKALQDPTLTLDKILTLSRTLETSKV